MKISFILGILVFFVSPTVAAAACFPYMPEKASMEGRVSMETTPGAKPETYFVMTLPAPVCVAPSERDKTNKPVADISKIQLRFSEKEALAMTQKLLSHMNSKIKCSGSFFLKHAEHHHTPVLMWTKECDPVASAPAKTDGGS